MDRTAYMKEYFQRNKEKLKISQYKWREKNREYVKEYMREYMKYYRKVPMNTFKGRRGKVKLEKKSNEGIRFIQKEVILYF